VIPIVEVPPAIIVNYFLELLPFQVISLPNYHILIVELVATIGYSFIVQLMSVSSETLDLVTLIAPVNSICQDIAIVGLVALASA
jgi:hypothetical protein